MSESRNPCPPLDFCRACRRGARSSPIHAGERTNPGCGRQNSSKVAIWRRYFGCRKYCRWHNIPKIGRRRESSFPALPAATQRVRNRCMHRRDVRLARTAACNGVCEEGVANGTAPVLSKRGLISRFFALTAGNFVIGERACPRFETSSCEGASSTGGRRAKRNGPRRGISLRTGEQPMCRCRQHGRKP